MNKIGQDGSTRTAYILNGKQRAILTVTAIVMVVMLLFPPFHVMREGHEVMALGHHFGLEFEQASVDRVMLCIQLVVTFLAGMMGVLLFHTHSSNRAS